MRLFITIIICLISVRLAAQKKEGLSDSLQVILEKQLLENDFNEKEEIINFLETTTKLNRISPSNALFYTEALNEKLLRTDNLRHLGTVSSYKGNYQWAQGLYASALKNYFKALEYFREYDNSEEVAKVLNNIGETYKKQQDYKKAAEFLKKALAMVTPEMQLKPHLIQVNLGQLFLYRNQLDSAKRYLENIIDIKDQVGENPLGFTYLYLGIIERKKENYNEALSYFNQSLKIWQRTNFTRSIVEAQLEKSRTFLEMNEMEKSASLLSKTEPVAVQIKALDLLMRLYSIRIELLKINGTKDDLAKSYDQYISIKDSIFSEEAREEISRLSIQYEVSEKERDYFKLALEQNILSSEVKRKNRFLLFLGSLIVFAIVFIVLLIIQRNKVKSSHKTVLIQKEELEKKRKELSEKSLELAKLNKELYQLNNDLESRIVERSREISEKNKKIADYAFFNSHKLRAPVASVLGLINILEISNEREVNETVINFLKESALELDEVIKQIRVLLEDEIERKNQL